MSTTIKTPENELFSETLLNSEHPCKERLGALKAKALKAMAGDFTLPCGHTTKIEYWHDVGYNTGEEMEYHCEDYKEGEKPCCESRCCVFVWIDGRKYREGILCPVCGNRYSILYGWNLYADIGNVKNNVHFDTTPLYSAESNTWREDFIYDEDEDFD
jgi:hypothetical protein